MVIKTVNKRYSLLPEVAEVSFFSVVITREINSEAIKCMNF